MADLAAADTAATLGAQFVARAGVHGRVDFGRHRDALVTALHAAAADYQRWGRSAAAFPIFDRDNWEVALISTEGGAIRDGAWVAWLRVAQAAGAGPIGGAVLAEARREPICRTVLP